MKNNGKCLMKFPEAQGGVIRHLALSNQQSKTHKIFRVINRLIITALMRRARHAAAISVSWVSYARCFIHISNISAVSCLITSVE